MNAAEMKPAPPVTRIRFTVSSIVYSGGLHVSLDARQVLPDQRMNPCTPRTKTTTAPPRGEVGLDDPVHDAVDPEREGASAERPQRDADPLDRLGQKPARTWQSRSWRRRVAGRALRFSATSTSTTLAPPERTSAFVNFCRPIAPSIGSSADLGRR